MTDFEPLSTMAGPLIVILFTNRNMVVFDRDGQQHELQTAVSCYAIDRPKLDELLKRDGRYYIACWREWKHEISKREFEYLLGQRTREKDIEDER